ncbi:MAG: DUF479 domain-containing protein [Bacteroidetes bacterium]|nr:DUF479 domain-containing protein [Bacteroidota bacterium]
MNFLAHALLSGTDPDILFGNFVADSIKGKKIEAYPDKVRLGVDLHRAIDSYTDTHPVVVESVARLRPEFRLFSAVIADIYFDHFLARNWTAYSQADLHVFAAGVYRILLKRYAILPPRSRRILPWMMAQNWLVGYANLRDLQRVFNGMSRRSAFDSGMEKAVDFLKLNYAEFEQDFARFFPDMILFATDKLNELNLPDALAGETMVVVKHPVQG